MSTFRVIILATGLCLALALARPAAAADWLTLDDYARMKQEDARTLGLVIQGMYEAVTYAQAAITEPSACYSPLPLPVDSLVEMIDREVATPSSTVSRYQPDDHLALVLVNALRSETLCQ